LILILILALSLSPSSAVLLLTAGLLLIGWELNHPGLILPGACGLLAALLAIAALFPLTSAAALLAFAVGSSLLLLSLRRALPSPLQATISIAFVVSFWSIGRYPPVRAANPVHWAIALPCGFLLGFGSLFLTRIARHARRNKGLD
jgi:membrane-bound ClpP family serine protease